MHTPLLQTLGLGCLHHLSTVLYRGPQIAHWSGSQTWLLLVAVKIQLLVTYLLSIWCLSGSQRIFQETIKCWDRPWSWEEREGWETQSEVTVIQYCLRLEEGLKHMGHLKPTAWSEGLFCQLKIFQHTGHIFPLSHSDFWKLGSVSPKQFMVTSKIVFFGPILLISWSIYK